MKLWAIDYDKGITLKALDDKLEILDLKYLDLLILHYQVEDNIDVILEKWTNLWNKEEIPLMGYQTLMKD